MAREPRVFKPSDLSSYNEHDLVVIMSFCGIVNEIHYSEEDMKRLIWEWEKETTEQLNASGI